MQCDDTTAEGGFTTWGNALLPALSGSSTSTRCYYCCLKKCTAPGEKNKKTQSHKDHHRVIIQLHICAANGRETTYNYRKIIYPPSSVAMVTSLSICDRLCCREDAVAAPGGGLSNMHTRVKDPLLDCVLILVRIGRRYKSLFFHYDSDSFKKYVKIQIFYM